VYIFQLPATSGVRLPAMSTSLVLRRVGGATLGRSPRQRRAADAPTARRVTCR
jgi:hypothetical protein